MSEADFPNSWDGVVEAAKAAGAKYPELVAAQWTLESARGTSTSGKHNYFGLKGQGSDCVTQACINGKFVTITDGFIDFDSLGQCVTYLVSRWYTDFEGYKGVNNAPDKEAAAHELVKQGYATDPAYAEKLIRLMHEHAG